MMKSNKGVVRIFDRPEGWVGYAPGSKLRIHYQNYPEGQLHENVPPPFEIPKGLPGNWFTAKETNYVLKGCWHSYCPGIYDRRNEGPTFNDDVRPTDNTGWVHVIEPNTELVCVQPITDTYGSYERDTHRTKAGDTVELQASTEVVVFTGMVKFEGEVYEAPAHIDAADGGTLHITTPSDLTTFRFKG